MGGLGWVELVVGANDLRVFYQPKLFFYSISKIATKLETLSCTGAEHQQVQILSLMGKGSKGGQCQDMKEWGQSLGPLHRSRCPTAKGSCTGLDRVGGWTWAGSIRQKIAWLVGNTDDAFREAREGNFLEQLSLSPMVSSPLCSLL